MAQEMYKHDAMLHLVWCVALSDKTWQTDDGQGYKYKTKQENAYLNRIREAEGITIDWADFNAKRKELGYDKEVIIDEACKALRGCGREWRIKALGYMQLMGWISQEDDKWNNMSDKEWYLIMRAQKELRLTDDERKAAPKLISQVATNIRPIIKSDLIPGKIYCFWNPTWKCFIKMTNQGLALSPKKEDGILPSNWDSERFLAVKSINNTVALWNPTHKCFIKMTDQKVTLSPKKEDGILPSNWDSERFLAVRANNNTVALWNPTQKCFIKMTDQRVTLSPKKEDGILPSNWASELFKLREI